MPRAGYVFKKSSGRILSGDEMVEFYRQLTAKYPIISIEDGCAENDWATWKKLTDAIGDRVQLVGDDLFVTNTSFLKKGIDTGTANSILVKVNQIGSLTETLDAPRSCGWRGRHTSGGGSRRASPSSPAASTFRADAHDIR